MCDRSYNAEHYTGIFTILASLASYLVLISSLDEVRFLSEEDKAYLKDRIQWDRGRREVVETGPLRREHILLAFKDVKVSHECAPLESSRQVSDLVRLP